MDFIGNQIKVTLENIFCQYVIRIIRIRIIDYISIYLIGDTFEVSLQF